MVRKIVSQGARYAFREAAHNLAELANLKISDSHVLRLTERVGKEWAQRRDQEIEGFKQDKLPRLYAQAPSAAAVRLDGLTPEEVWAGTARPQAKRFLARASVQTVFALHRLNHAGDSRLAVFDIQASRAMKKPA